MRLKTLHDSEAIVPDISVVHAHTAESVNAESSSTEGPALLNCPPRRLETHVIGFDIDDGDSDARLLTADEKNPIYFFSARSCSTPIATQNAPTNINDAGRDICHRPKLINVTPAHRSASPAEIFFMNFISFL